MKEIISSLSNETIKKYRKLKQKKYREIEQMFIIEGEHLIEEALKTQELVCIITNNLTYENNEIRVIYVKENIMESLSFHKSVCEYIAIVKYNQSTFIKDEPIVVLDNLQDPSNVGALMRNALAFNIKNILISLDSVDIYHHKLIQASQGANFQLNIIVKDLKKSINLFKEEGYQVIATSLDNSQTLNINTKFSNKCLFVFGNEGQGISSEILSLSDINYKIPINNIDSLNVAASSAIIFYHFNLQKVAL